MSDETVLDRVGWLFMVLAVVYMASAMLAIKSGDSTTPVPKNAAVQQLLKADTADSGKNLMDMATYLKFICYTFNIGCLFYLKSVLKEGL